MKSLSALISLIFFSSLSSACDEPFGADTVNNRLQYLETGGLVASGSFKESVGQTAYLDFRKVELLKVHEPQSGNRPGQKIVVALPKFASSGIAENEQAFLILNWTMVYPERFYHSPGCQPWGIFSKARGIETAQDMKMMEDLVVAYQKAKGDKCALFKLASQNALSAHPLLQREGQVELRWLSEKDCTPP